MVFCHNFTVWCHGGHIQYCLCICRRYYEQRRAQHCLWAGNKFFFLLFIAITREVAMLYNAVPLVMFNLHHINFRCLCCLDFADSLCKIRIVKYIDFSVLKGVCDVCSEYGDESGNRCIPWSPVW